MPLHLKFHGALGEVTGSVSFFRHARTGHVFAVDCGSAHKREELQEPAHPKNLPEGCKVGQLKGLFLTHAHADHVGMLLHWVKAGFVGPIYCTTETARCAHFACEDSLRILLDDCRNKGKVAEIGDSERLFAQELLSRHVPCVPGREIEIEAGLSFVGFPTSHIMGCVGFQFSATDAAGETTRVFFTGDVGTVEDEQETRSLMRTRVRPGEPSDYVITESTYGDRSRAPGDRSAKARLLRMSEVLERGFRHGTSSKVIFPAFSLQRSQDLLLDIYQVLAFNRARTGLPAGVVPKVYLDSTLATSFMSVFREVYRQGAGGSSPWVNPYSSLFAEFAGDAERIDDTLDKLLRFEGKGACVRLYHQGEAVEVFCGSPRHDSQGPQVIICGSGMTVKGAIQRYLHDHVEDGHATFVISGYVPPGSPGARLLNICKASAGQRATLTFELKEDAKRSLPAKTLFGTDIKADCASVSDFYSGHADGPSVCRYALGEGDAEIGNLKRVFLMHGEDASRAGLMRLLQERLADRPSDGGRFPVIECPYRQSPWFDCGADRWLEDRPVTVSLSVLVPVGDDILGAALSVFPPAGVRTEQGRTVLRLQSGGAASETTLRLKTFNGTHHKLIAETTFSGVEGLLDAGRVAFRWREVLNALQLQKGEYFAGHKLCATEQEFQEFERMRRNLLQGGRQRVHGFVVAGKSAFDAEELSAMESLLTPHVPFFVLDNQYLARVNAALFADQDMAKLSKGGACYVPLKLSDPLVPIAKPFGWECLRGLLEQVAHDAQIKETRQPARPAASSVAQPSVRPSGTVVPTGRIPPDRAAIPAEAYAALRVGQKVEVVVEAPFSNGKAKGTKLISKVTQALGVVYGVNYLGGKFEHPVGSTIDAYVKRVKPELREVEFILSPPCEDGEAVRFLEASSGTVSWGKLAELIPCDFRTLVGLVGDYCKLLLDDHRTISPEVPIPAGQEVDIYLLIVRGLEQERIRRNSLPPSPEPFTRSKMAQLLGEQWKATDIEAAARYFEGAAQETLVSMAREVLAQPADESADGEFPLEHKDLFYAACVEASDAGWGGVPVVAAEPPARPLPAPSHHVLRELAAIWGVSPAALLLEAEGLGLDLRAEVVLDTPSALRLTSPASPSGVERP